MAVLPVPVVIDGEPEVINYRGYWPGDALPPHVYIDGDHRKYVLDAKGETYVADRTHVLPVKVLYPDGTEGPVELDWWWPGQRFPDFWQRGTQYSYDKKRGVYVQARYAHRSAWSGVGAGLGVWLFFGAFGGAPGAVAGAVIFAVILVCSLVAGVKHIADPPSKENAYR